jgi:hypothetical protein
MWILAFLAKPLLYVAAFAVAAAALPAPGAPPRPRVWLRVLLAACGRLLVGVAIGIVAVLAAGGAAGSATRLLAFVLPLGFLAWLGVARLAFPGGSLGRALAFAAVAEAMSGTIDAFAFDGASQINFC